MRWCLIVTTAILLLFIVVWNAHAKTMSDHGVLKIGATYEASVQYCRDEADVRIYLNNLREFGYLPAQQQWIKKIGDGFAPCHEDAFNEATKFTVISDKGPDFLDGSRVYIVEVDLLRDGYFGSIKAYIISTVPVR